MRRPPELSARSATALCQAAVFRRPTFLRNAAATLAAVHTLATGAVKLSLYCPAVAFDPPARRDPGHGCRACHRAVGLRQLSSRGLKTILNPNALLHKVLF